VGIDKTAMLEPAWHQKPKMSVMIPRIHCGCSV
jgi:hypothetical protein